MPVASQKNMGTGLGLGPFFLYMQMVRSRLQVTWILLRVRRVRPVLLSAPWQPQRSGSSGVSDVGSECCREVRGCLLAETMCGWNQEERRGV